MDVIVLPIVFEDEVRGVLELASLQRFNPAHQAFLDQLTESIGIVINTISANMRTEDLLTQSQSLAEELQSRQQELQQTNEELQEKARLLVHQNQEVERKNQEVEQARQALEEKAEQLALTSKYKSEFLANMSHELRTPLNSLLILSDQLCKNGDGNLTPRQVEFAKTIHLSGNDLLMLINDILDLSKIESGTVAVEVSELRMEELQRSVERSFRHVAEAKHVEFEIHMAEGTMLETIVTDVKRLQQVIKNLLSNAFKFTHHGSVSLAISRVDSGWSRDSEELNRAGQVVAFAVSDTGIGISADKQQIVFEAFQQADGSTSRKYGGTGLGLAISRELARLLGGEIRLSSTPSQGSTFTLYLPQRYSPSRAARLGRSGDSGWQGGARNRAADSARWALVEDSGESSTEFADEADDVIAVNIADDDRDAILPGDKVALIVENDVAFAKVLLQAARRNGLKGLVSLSGAGALTLTRDYRPSLITLDIFLPDMEGWRILERMKSDWATRHVPVCVVSTDDSRERALNSGAMGFLAKPLQSIDQVDEALAQLSRYVRVDARKMLVAMSSSTERDAFLQITGVPGIETVVASDAAAMRAALADPGLDCVVTDGSLGGLSGTEMLDLLELRSPVHPLPVVLFTGGPENHMHPVPKYESAGSIWLQAMSLDQLVDASAFVLHRPVSGMSEQELRSVRVVSDAKASLAGKKVLIVDDDMRNIFALATVLDEHGMLIISAENGRDAIRLVEEDPDIDIVLMDIMMPEMDGMQTMRELRKLPRGKQLPLVAVTAKAIKGDREKCIEAGAWDYLSKPVDTSYLLVVLRGWLCK